MFEHIDVILIIFGTIYTIWFYCRLANGKFDAGEINENDVELSEDSDRYGYEIASVKQGLRDGKKFFRKFFH